MRPVKKCPICGEVKLASGFYSHGAKLQAYCKPCGNRRRHPVAVPRAKAWSEADLQRVREMYAEAPPLRSKELAEKLGRTVEAVTLKGQRMGLGNMYRPKVVERKNRKKYATVEELRAAQSAERKA